MSGSVIVGGSRTPIGKLGGALGAFSATELGATAIREALASAGVSSADVDYVIMGHVIQAGAGQITARQAAVGAGIPMTVPALTVNKVCLSGLNAIAMADQLIGYGEFDVIVAGGMESMTGGPYLLPGARAGYRYGDNTIIDATQHDALFCSFDQLGMGDATDRYNRVRGIGRAEQDEFAAMSHERATTASRTVSSTPRSCPSRYPSVAANHCSSPTTRESAPAPRPNRWAGCARRSPPTAPSPRDRLPRSPTAPPPSWS
jgi:acetyl-CoA C-acetyltransferase